MKIAILADPLDNQRGGVHVYTRELVNALSQLELANEYLIVRTKPGPDLPGTKQIVIPEGPLGLISATIRKFFTVPYQLRKYTVDAVLEPAHFGPFNLPSNVHRVTVIHDLTPLLFPQYHLWRSQILQRLFLKRILRKASLVITNSRHTQSDVLRYFPFLEGRTVSAPLGVRPGLQPTGSMAWLNSKGINEGFWLSVGTIEPRKNLVRLLQAYQEYREQGGNRKLLFTGQKGWKSEDFFNLLDHHPYLPDILLTGFVPDHALPELYSHAQALIYPSEYEGFGLPVLEALRCGCPVICSATSSLPEVGGDLAYYIDYQDAASITTQMHVIDQLGAKARSQLQQRAMEWASRFSWKAHANACVAAIQNLIVKQPDSSNV